MFKFDADGIEMVKGALARGVVTVIFTKADGTERRMVCTTKMEKIPTECHPSGTSKRSNSTEAHRVFDIEKNAWRSFRWDSVKDVEL